MRLRFFKQQLSEADVATADRKITIDYLRHASPEEYKKVLQIVEIRRKADEDVRVVEYGSKKAAREARKANDDIVEAENMLSDIEEEL